MESEGKERNGIENKDNTRKYKAMHDMRTKGMA
jgi:hypothetical protein